MRRKSTGFLDDEDVSLEDLQIFFAKKASRTSMRGRSPDLLGKEGLLDGIVQIF